MLQEVFKRYEKKYLLTEDGFRRLMLAVGGSFQPDQYEQYQISNIYFDTPDTADVVFILAAFAAELRFLRGFLVVPLLLFYVYYSTYY